MATKRIRQNGKVFRDPVHGLIRIEPDDDFLLDLVDTPEFQRLRRIRQLGVSSLTYPGAVHTRFAHSLGVLNFTQLILATLNRRYSQETKVTIFLNQYSRELKAAALLHDIGHGPFSHMIERAGIGFKHEDKSIELIQDGAVGTVLAAHKVDAAKVAAIIRQDVTAVPRLVIDIVSSQLDADRMDYLLRDSHFTGVEYGKYDSDWILNSLCLGLDPSSEGQGAEDSWRLCLDERRGRYSAEQFIVARTHMHLQVYFHRVTRGYEAVLLTMFKLVQQAIDELADLAPPAVSRFFRDPQAIEGDDWVQLDDYSMTVAMQAWSRFSGGSAQADRVASLARAYLERGHQFGSVDLEGSVPVRLTNQLTAAGLMSDIDWVYDEGKMLPYKDITYSYGQKDDEGVSVESVLVSDGDLEHSARPLEARSPLLKALSENRNDTQRLYFDLVHIDRFLPIFKSNGVDWQRSAPAAEECCG